METELNGDDTIYSSALHKKNRKKRAAARAAQSEVWYHEIAVEEPAVEEAAAEEVAAEASPVEEAAVEEVAIEEPAVEETPARTLIDPSCFHTLYKPQPIVEITVGSGHHSEPFYVHKDYLCLQSPYFASHFRRESKSKKPHRNVKKLRLHHLPHTDPKAFGLFLEWLYSKTITVPSTRMMTASTFPPSHYIGGDLHDCEVLSSLVRLWLLAETLQIPVLQNQTIDLLIRETVENGNSYPEQCHIIYRSAPKSSPLRRYIIDLWCWSADTEIYDYENPLETFPAEMIFDLLVANRKRFTRKGTLWRNQAISPLEDSRNYHVKTRDFEDDVVSLEEGMVESPEVPEEDPTPAAEDKRPEEPAWAAEEEPATTEDYYTTETQIVAEEDEPNPAEEEYPEETPVYPEEAPVPMSMEAPAEAAAAAVPDEYARAEVPARWSLHWERN